MGTVVSYLKQSDGKYQVIANLAGQSQPITISDCYRFKIGLRAPLASVQSSDGYYFLNSTDDSLLDQFKDSPTKLKKVIYYYDKLIPVTNGEAPSEIIDLSHIDNNTFNISIPNNYCFNVDPPHPLLTPVCKIQQEDQQQQQPNIFENQKILIIIIIVVFIMLCIFVSSAFLLLKK